MELLRREKEANVKPDSDIDMYMKVKKKQFDEISLLIYASNCCQDTT